MIGLNGRKVYAVWWPDVKGNKGVLIKSGRNRILEMSCSHHGDHDEFWIIEMNADRKELARHNVKYVESIVWNRNS